jgi:flavin reductase (DIM6/NTAB) family NADH-FMN oxidoreductase RutF
MKVPFGAVSPVYPIPIVLGGANVHGKPNYLTLGDCGIMGLKPALVYVSLHRDHFTAGGILENGTFSINIPDSPMLQKVDYCGIVSGRDKNKSALFNTFYGELKTAPMISECPVNLECEVIKEFLIEHRHIFIGKVIQTYVDDRHICEREGRRTIADLTELDPILYSINNRYHKIGQAIGWGYQEGKDL